MRARAREGARLALGESYRTVLGHFRHEIGHYYWDRLVADSPALEPFRRLFGDERASYDEAAQRHYRDGAPADWRNRFVSAYASMHPWEDWAESWAHYLHMVDTLETARSFGARPAPAVGRRARGRGAPRAPRSRRTRATLDFDDFDDLVRRLGAAQRRAQRPEPQHGRSRRLSVRAVRAGGREAALRAPGDRSAPREAHRSDMADDARAPRAEAQRPRAASRSPTTASCWRWRWSAPAGWRRRSGRSSSR